MLALEVKLGLAKEKKKCKGDMYYLASDNKIEVFQPDSTGGSGCL